MMSKIQHNLFKKKEYKLRISEIYVGEPVIVVENKSGSRFSSISIYVGIFKYPDILENLKEIVLYYDHNSREYIKVDENKFRRKILDKFHGPVRYFRPVNIDLLKYNKDGSLVAARNGIEAKLQEYP